MNKYFHHPIVKLSQLNSRFDGYSLRAFNKNSKICNFSPGPAPIPNYVLNKINEEFYSLYPKYQYGTTPLEMSHRCPEFDKILEGVNTKMKNYLNIPDNFEILWTQGGGHGQFSSIPLNLQYLLNNSKTKANYIVNGTWSARAYNEAKKFVNCYNSIENFYDDKQPLMYNNMPDYQKFDKDDGYLYLCSNETVNGIEFRRDGIPYPNKDEIENMKIIVDMSSDLTMKEIEWKNIDMAFACTSKNLGVAGANVTIVNRDLLNDLKVLKSEYNNNIPCTLDWNLYYESNSLYNTPSIFNIYLINHILDYYIDNGGIKEMENISRQKAKLIYDLLDNSEIYKPFISNTKIRSNINIPFIVCNGNKDMMSKFLDYCNKNNVVGLRTKTPFKYEELNMNEPLRISLYNGITIEDTKNLVNVMESFERIFKDS